MRLKLYLLLISLIALIFYLPQSVFAQTKSLDVTYTYNIADKDASDGDILIFSDNGIVRASSPYNNKIFGVLQDNPLIVYREVEGNKKPVIRSGVALVNVTNAGGEVKAGDFITSSAQPGKGQKATLSGYVIGVATQDLTGNLSKIQVAIRIEYAELSSPRSFNSLFNLFGSAFLTNLQNPERFTQLIRYIAASLVVLISLAVGFFTFARTIPRGIEAIGRNPLSRNAIQLTIILNIFFTILIALAGIVAAFLILRL